MSSVSSNSLGGCPPGPRKLLLDGMFETSCFWFPSKKVPSKDDASIFLRLVQTGDCFLPHTRVRLLCLNHLVSNRRYLGLVPCTCWFVSKWCRSDVRTCCKRRSLGFSFAVAGSMKWPKRRLRAIPLASNALLLSRHAPAAIRSDGLSERQPALQGASP